jgi:GntR family transcriptional regulator
MDERLPRYQRLRDHIAAEIAANVWPPGEAIPSESELAERHNVALGTVRRAMEVLVAEGLVERVHGRGTFVRRPSFDKSMARFLRHMGRDGKATIPESRILECSVALPPAPVALRLKLSPKAKAICLKRLRLVEGKAVMAEEIWLPHALFARLLEVSPADMGDLLYPFYEKQCGQSIASAEESLTVEPVDAAHARLLDIGPNDPVVAIERLALGYDRRPLEWRRSLAPAATFHYRVEIR